MNVEAWQQIHFEQNAVAVAIAGGTEGVKMRLLQVKIAQEMKYFYKYIKCRHTHGAVRGAGK